MPLDKTLDAQVIENKFIKIWEDSGAFSCNPASDKPSYVIPMPPPNVTGTLHIGHALTFTLQDIMIRYNRMKGKDTLWQPGTDHAGIAVQAIIDRQLDSEGLSRNEIGREAFMQRAWAWRKESGGAIISQLQRLGTSPDWQRARFTMDEGLSHAVREIFVRLYEDGLIYKDKRLVNWDVALQTAISDLEVEERELDGNLWHFKYPLENNAGFIVVATTRPETLLGDSGIAVHPQDERYEHLVGKKAVLPLVGRLLPIVADTYADPEKGTGAVKITPAHDFNDFDVGKRHNLEIINIFDHKAQINAQAPQAYQSLDRFHARKAVVTQMEAQGLLVKVETQNHKVPHGDRSGTIIEPFLTEQWFVNAAKLAEPAIEAVTSGATQIFPDNHKKTYFQWMNNIQPWCISRQLWWGHQIPAWYGPDNKVFVARCETEAQKEANTHYGKSVTLRRDPDVLDTWFSSGLWPFSTLGWPHETRDLERYYPADLLVTGWDIIFFWVARMMMMGIYVMDPQKPLSERVPFRQVYIHTLVRDKFGNKMSKSKGNVIDPLEIIEKYSCDALRFTMCALAAPGRDIKLDENRVEGYRNFTTKLWNAVRWAEFNKCTIVDNFNPGALKHLLNRWIVSKLTTAAQKAEKGIGSFRYNDTAHALYQFVWSEFCDWYIELAKPILYGTDEAAITEVKATAAWVLKNIVHLLHPITPFSTEELWEKYIAQANGIDAQKQRLICASWPDLDPRLCSETRDIDWLITLISEIRTARAELNVPASAKVALFIQNASKESLKRVKEQKPLIERLARLSSLDILKSSAPRLCAQLVVEEATYFMPLEGIIDLEAERIRLDKSIEKSRKEALKLSKMLANTAFLAKAPKDVIAKQHDDLASLEKRLVGLERARTRLA